MKREGPRGLAVERIAGSEEPGWDGLAATQADFNAFLAGRSLESAQIALPVAGGLFLLFGVGHIWLLPPTVANVMIPLAFGASFVALFGSVFIRRVNPSPRAGRAALAVAGAVGALNVLGHFALTGQPHDAVGCSRSWRGRWSG